MNKNISVKKAMKYIVDIVMLLLLPALMAEMLMGQEIHEWIGVISFIAFAAHHILNYRWWAALFQGNYTPVRCLVTAVNLLLLADIFALITSGVMISGFVLEWLHISGGMLIARKLHLSASYWGLILMSAHIGFHACAGAAPLKEKKASIAWITRTLAIVVSIYGIYAFFSQKISNYLFFQTHFVFYDEAKPALVFISETVALIVLFATVFYYLRKLLAKINCKESTQKLFKWLAFLLPLSICLTVALSIGIGSTSAPL